MLSDIHDQATRDGASPPNLTIQQLADRVATLLAGFETVSTPRQARESAELLVQTIVGMYEKGLERVLEIVYDAAGDRADAIFEQLAADRFVEGLLCLHGLHPIAVEDRVAAALDAVRPYLESHEGGVEVAGIADGVVLLRLEGSCDGCPSSAATVKLAVERAILERVPEIHEVRALGGSAADARPTLKLESDWIRLHELAGLAAAPDAGLHARDISGTPTLFVRFDDTVYAYRNVCPSCASGFDDARLTRPVLTCAACGAAFDIVHAGRPAGAGPAAEPFPLRRDNGSVRVSIPLRA